MDCIFCKIIAGDVPAYQVYEDENVLAFLDVAPVNYGHILVIPKGHFANLEEIPEEKLAAVAAAVKKVGQALKRGLGAAGYNVQVNNDPVAGQVVPHLHFHVIPRQAGDGLKLWPQGKYADGEADEVAEKIKKAL